MFVTSHSPLESSIVVHQNGALQLSQASSSIKFLISNFIRTLSLPSDESAELKKLNERVISAVNSFNIKSLERAEILTLIDTIDQLTKQKDIFKQSSINVALDHEIMQAKFKLLGHIYLFQDEKFSTYKAEKQQAVIALKDDVTFVEEKLNLSTQDNNKLKKANGRLEEKYRNVSERANQYFCDADKLTKENFDLNRKIKVFEANAELEKGKYKELEKSFEELKKGEENLKRKLSENSSIQEREIKRLKSELSQVDEHKKATNQQILILQQGLEGLKKIQGMSKSEPPKGVKTERNSQRK